MDVHYRLGNGQTIEASSDELVVCYQLGRINNQTLVWSRGMDEWLPLGQSPLQYLVEDLPPPLPEASSASPKRTKEKIMVVAHQESALLTGAQCPDPVEQEFPNVSRLEAIEMFAQGGGFARYDLVITDTRLIFFPVEKNTGIASLRDGSPDGMAATMTVLIGGIWVTEAIRSLLKKFKPGQHYEVGELDQMIEESSAAEMYFDRITAVKLGRMKREMLIYKGGHIMRIEGFDGSTNNVLNVEFGVGSNRKKIMNTFFKTLPFPVEPEFQN